MSYVDDYGLDAPARGLILLVLSIEDKNNKKNMDILHIQKTIRYFMSLTGKKNIDYSNFKLGGVSYEVEENLETLVELGLVEQHDRHYANTLEGEKAIDELAKIHSKDMDKLIFAKNRLNNLSGDEAMYFMYGLLPETRLNSTKYAELEKDHYKLIRSLFLKGAIDKENYRFFGITEKEFNESMTVANDPELMEAIEIGAKDLQQGNVRPLSDLLHKHKVNCT